jgi:hypothetical protein
MAHKDDKRAISAWVLSVHYKALQREARRRGLSVSALAALLLEPHLKALAEAEGIKDRNHVE